MALKELKAIEDNVDPVEFQYHQKTYNIGLVGFAGDGDVQPEPGDSTNIQANNPQEAWEKFYNQYPNFHDGEGDQYCTIDIEEENNEEPIAEAGLNNGKPYFRLMKDAPSEENSNPVHSRLKQIEKNASEETETENKKEKPKEKKNWWEDLDKKSTISQLKRIGEDL